MSSVFCFAGFELHAAQRQLLQNGHALQPGPGGRALELLILLAEQRHRTGSKAELIDHCWPHQAVEPNNLAVQIWALRRLLGRDVIDTVPGRGYRFVARTQLAGTDAPAEMPTACVISLAPPPAHNLPPMFGRSADLALLLSLLRQHRLVTLLGPLGVGKTRLAQAVPGAAPDLPAVAVDLAPVHHYQHTLLMVYGNRDGVRDEVRHCHGAAGLAGGQACVKGGQQPVAARRCDPETQDAHAVLLRWGIEELGRGQWAGMPMPL